MKKFSLAILILILSGCDGINLYPKEYDLQKEVCAINGGWDYTHRKLSSSLADSYYYEIFCNDGARFIRIVKFSDVDGSND